jgi:RES domain
MSARIGFRHCDPRFGFMWRSQLQPAARWHGAGDGPANYFADTPVGAWAEFLRHEGITDATDLAGVRRSLWAVELPNAGYEAPELAHEVLTGDTDSYAVCRQEALRLRAAGAERVEAPSAALLPGGATGWFATETRLVPAAPPRDGLVWVLFGSGNVPGWIAVDGGAPPASVLPLVRRLGKP